MLIDDQYRLIAPDTITAVLGELGWKNHGSFDVEGEEADVWRKGSLLILVKDGDQRDALSAVFDYEGPEAVAEIWARSSGFHAGLNTYLRACQEGLPRERIHCHHCGARHVDVGEFAVRPHHTHKCGECGKLFDNEKWSFGA